MRLTTGFRGALGLLVLSAVPAFASPPILDRVPPDALAVVCVSNPTQFHKSLGDFLREVDAPFPLPPIEAVLLQMGIPEGLDFTKPIAAVILPPADPDDVDAEELAGNAVALLPVTDYKQFLAGLNAQHADGLDTATIDEEDVFIKDIGGGYAAVSPHRHLVAAFEGQPGNAQALRALIGKAGDTLTDESGLFFLLNVQAAKPFQDQFMEAMQDQLADNPALSGLGMVGLPAQGLIDAFAEDARAMVIGVTPDSRGIALNLAVSFGEGSAPAKAMSARGDAGALLKKLPNQPYLFAFAFDTSDPAVRTFLARALALEGADKPGLGAMLAKQVLGSDGAATVIGAPPGGILGGIFTSTVSYVKTSRPDDYIGAIKAALAELNGQRRAGLTFSTSFEEGATEIGGKNVDSWAVKLATDEEDDDEFNQMAMVLPMVFGPAGGPGGYVAPADGGIVQTFAKNSMLMGAALAAAKNGENLGKDTLTGQVAAKLPPNRVVEAYIGAKSILEALMPLMAMGGFQINVQVPAQLPPIGLGLAAADGSAHASLYLPAPVVKAISALVQDVQGGMMGGEDEEFDPAGRDGGKKPTGQPRF